MAVPILLAGLTLLAVADTPSKKNDDKVHRLGRFDVAATGAMTERFGYYPIQLALSYTKPDGITKEPHYMSTPKYGVIHLGDGPNSDTIVAVDQPWNADWKIYIDKNHNGDLTDDGDGSWNSKKDNGGRTMYGPMNVPLRASYGNSKHETSSRDYELAIYMFADARLPNPLMYRQSAQMGTVSVDGKAHKAVLVENDADALFNKKAKNADEAKTSHPIWMKVDMNDDGKYASGIIDVRGPFKIGAETYVANISDDGARVALLRTKKKPVELSPKAAPALALLKSGSAAPDFTCEKYGGGNIKLSDYKGKIVILDFWATWCGPCQKSMPHVEAVSHKVSDQDVQVLGVCVWDGKAAYTDWVPKNQSKYTFQFAFDPAANNTANSIATKLFHVSGIPTTYIIDKDGNVADAIVGYDDGDTRLEAALKKLGVNVQ